jgi:hypothetical protein
VTVSEGALGAATADWLPPGKRAGVVLTVDDVHPGRSTDPYEAGGDLGAGALGHVEWLLERHPELRVTLFVTPDWREIDGRPTRRLLSHLPVLRDRCYLTRIHPAGTMRLDRHPAFVQYICGLARTDVAMHGLHHVHRGPRVVLEFQEQSAEHCEAMLLQGLAVFERAGIRVVKGMAPPGWEFPEGLRLAMSRLRFDFVAAARDLVTPVSPTAKTAMSGLRGMSLIYPELLTDGHLVHITSNFQATSDVGRALQIVENGGLLAIKAHITRFQLDRMDEVYRNYLDGLLCLIERRYGESIWWTTMREVAEVRRGVGQSEA